jgi:hypothetical protein
MHQIKDLNPAAYFGIFDVVHLDAVWLDKHDQPSRHRPMSAQIVRIAGRENRKLPVATQPSRSRLVSRTAGVGAAGAGSV